MQHKTLGEEYVLLKELGKGGYATVYKAKNIEYGYIRAIRILDSYVDSEDSKVFRNFQRECRILLRLGNGSHPNIVHVYQPRYEAGRAFVEMDWVDGVDLRQLIEQYAGVVPIGEITRMVKEIGSALAYCHHDIYKVCYDRDSDNIGDADDGSALISLEKEKELIVKYRVLHNDIHTGNIMRRRDGTYVLLDFGLAVDGNSDVINSSRRGQGAVEYLSAQRLDGLNPTPQDDIYAFGCVLYAMLTGTPPFPIQTKNKDSIPLSEQTRVLEAHKNTPPSPITRSDVPQWLKDMAMCCLQKDPSQRFADGYELYQFVKKHVQEAEEKNVRDKADEVSDDLQKKIKQVENERLLLSNNLAEVTTYFEKEKIISAELESMLSEQKKENIRIQNQMGVMREELDSAKKRRHKIWLPLILGMVVGAGLLFGILKASLIPPIEQSIVKERYLGKINELEEQNDQLHSVIDSLNNRFKIISAEGKGSDYLAKMNELQKSVETLAQENEKLRNRPDKVISNPADTRTINLLKKRCSELENDLKNEKAKTKTYEKIISNIGSEKKPPVKKTPAPNML